MARGKSGSPGVFVAALTAAALAVVGFFAYQAAAAPDRPSQAAELPAEEAGPDGGEQSRDIGEPSDEDSAEGRDDPRAAPLDSGEGMRVVYSLGQQRVWLIDSAEDGLGEEVLRTYAVHRSSVDPDPGSYVVDGRTSLNTGSDGVPIENVVLFGTPSDVVFGFSTATDGSVPDPNVAQRTGGVRQSAEDGEAMWEFATIGVPVIVVP